MNFSLPFVRVLLAATMLLAARSPGIAKAVSTTKEGITLAAESTIGPSGKTHITCSLTNDSPFVLAAVNTPSKCPCFQFKLLDSKGKHILQNVQWAKVHQQDELNDESLNARGINQVYVYPSKKREFQFDLEDAYGDRAAQGRTLEVKWRNIFGGPETPIEVPESIGTSGTIVPAHDEKNHFPGLWTVSVSVPLPQRAGDKSTSPDSDHPSANQPPEKTSQETPSSKTPQLIASTPKNPPTSPNPWWWALLAIPALLMVWLGLRTRKQT